MSLCFLNQTGMLSQETLYLDSISGMTDSIIEGMQATKKECSTELKWKKNIKQAQKGG